MKDAHKLNESDSFTGIGLRLAAIIYEFIACRLANHALAAES